MKNKNILFVLIMIIGIIFIPVLNYFADPYGIFFKHSDILPHEHDNERDTIFQRLKLNKLAKYDYLLIGDSNADICYNSNDFRNITGKSIDSVTLQGISLQEQLYLLKIYLKLHPEVKYVIVSVNFIRLLESPMFNLPNYKDGLLTPNEYIKLLFTFKTTCYSLHFGFYILFYKICKFFVYIREKYKFNYKVPICVRVICPTLRVKINVDRFFHKNLDTLKEIVEYLEKNNINYIFILNTCHTYTLANIYLSDKWDLFMNLKKEISKIVPYYDFSYVNQYNSSPITFENKYFNDAMHSTNEYGYLIFKRVFLNKETDFGYIIDIKNADVILKHQSELIKDFIKNNKDIVDLYMNNKFNDTTALYEYEYL